MRCLYHVRCINIAHFLYFLKDGDAPSGEVVLLTFSSRPCCQLQLIEDAAQSTEGYFLFMRHRWCVLEGKAKVDVRYIVTITN